MEAEEAIERAAYPGIGDSFPPNAIVYPHQELEWHCKSWWTRLWGSHGHRDWRLPTASELNVLFNNRAAIGGWTRARLAGHMNTYWSSTKEHIQDDEDGLFVDDGRRYCMATQNFTDGSQSWGYSILSRHHVRYVRG